MIGCSIKNRENYLRKCFRTIELETRVDLYPTVSANRLSNNWALQQVFSKNLKRQISRSHLTEPWSNLWSSQHGFSTPGGWFSGDRLTWTYFIPNFCLCHVLISGSYFFAVAAPLRLENSFTVEGVNKRQRLYFFFSWTSIRSFRIQTQKILPTFDDLNEMESGLCCSSFQWPLAPIFCSRATRKS